MNQKSTARYHERRSHLWSKSNLARNAIVFVAVIILGIMVWNVHFDMAKLAKGIPKLISWIPRMFPPNVEHMDEILKPALETLSMATTGTLIGVIISFPLSFFAARNTTPNSLLYYLTRTLFQLSRGTESMVFALIFVAAIGFGPFTGVLAIACHTIGVTGKLFAEIFEPADIGPLDALKTTGASRAKIFRYALLPDVMPGILSAIMYMIEFNVRTSTVLGIVGAGGIGQTLKDTIDLLDFQRMITVMSVILIMVFVIDALSSKLRKTLLHSVDGRDNNSPIKMEMSV